MKEQKGKVGRMGIHGLVGSAAAWHKERQRRFRFPAWLNNAIRTVDVTQSKARTPRHSPDTFRPTANGVQRNDRYWPFGDRRV